MAKDNVAEDLRAELKTLADTLEEVLNSSTDKSKEEIGKLRSKAESALKESRVRLGETSDALMKQTRETAARADEYVRENPWTGVGIGVVQDRIQAPVIDVAAHRRCAAGHLDDAVDALLDADARRAVQLDAVGVGEEGRLLHAVEQQLHAGVRPAAGRIAVERPRRCRRAKPASSRWRFGQKQLRGGCVRFRC